ncbi:MAG TPA: radical SAM protein [Spirochaetota bacterium]|nr:radical SAM protein [Spirochaetota bacterium]
MSVNNKNEIFKPTLGNKLSAGSSYLAKYITKKPLVFNLNFNVTNICNQQCPMCNAALPGRGGESITFEAYKEIIEKLKHHKIASLTLSGGEPSLVKDIDRILDYSARQFKFGVNVNSNLYANEKIIRPFAEAALRNNIRIGTSFDGIGAVADKLRGAKDVSARVLKNIEMVTEMKKEMNSGSTLNMNTVISDQNLHQIPDILAISEKFGWTHTLAPWNSFFYQKKDPNMPTLHYTEELEKVIKFALTRNNISCSREFLSRIPEYTKKGTEKLCPYLTGIFRSYKIFVDPNGDLSLCSRKPIGNLHKSELIDILNSKEYLKDVEGYKKCEGCWMACFVEVLLASPNLYRNKVKNIY